MNNRIEDIRKEIRYGRKHGYCLVTLLLLERALAEEKKCLKEEQDWRPIMKFMINKCTDNIVIYRRGNEYDPHYIDDTSFSDTIETFDSEQEARNYFKTCSPELVPERNIFIQTSYELLDEDGNVLETLLPSQADYQYADEGSRG